MSRARESGDDAGFCQAKPRSWSRPLCEIAGPENRLFRHLVGVFEMGSTPRVKLSLEDLGNVHDNTGDHQHGARQLHADQERSPSTEFVNHTRSSRHSPIVHVMLSKPSARASSRPDYWSRCLRFSGDTYSTEIARLGKATRQMLLGPDRLWEKQARLAHS